MKKAIFGVTLLVLGALLGLIISGFVPHSNDISVYSNLLLSLITLIGAVAAFTIYFNQKKDFKKDAANIVYLEIVSAERVMKQAKQDLEKGALPAVFLINKAMQMESWSKYKYLFVRDFSDVEWEAISDFYNKAHLFDEAVTHNSSFFQKNEEQIRVNLQRILADYLKDSDVTFENIQKDDKEAKKWTELISLTDNFANKFMARMTDSKGNFFYSPKKPIDDVTLYLNNVNLDLSQSSSGLKLRKLASLNS